MGFGHSPFEADHSTDNDHEITAPDGTKRKVVSVGEPFSDKFYDSGDDGAAARRAFPDPMTSLQNDVKLMAEQVKEIHAIMSALAHGLGELQENPPPGPMGMIMKMFLGNVKVNGEPKA